MMRNVLYWALVVSRGSAASVYDTGDISSTFGNQPTSETKSATNGSTSPPLSWNITMIPPPITDNSGDKPVIKIEYRISNREFDVKVLKKDCETPIPDIFEKEVEDITVGSDNDFRNILISLNVDQSKVEGSDIWESTSQQFSFCLSTSLLTSSPKKTSSTIALPEKTNDLISSHFLKPDVDISLIQVSSEGTFTVDGKVYPTEGDQVEIFTADTTFFDEAEKPDMNLVQYVDGDDVVVINTDVNSNEIDSIVIYNKTTKKTKELTNVGNGQLAIIDDDLIDTDRLKSMFVYGEPEGISSKEDYVEVEAGGPSSIASSAVCDSYRRLDLAVVFESSFCAEYGKDMQKASNAATALVALVSIMYEQSGLCVKVKISHLEGHCVADTDPYKQYVDLNLSGCGGVGLLSGFTEFWNANRVGVKRDLAQLFSGTGLECKSGSCIVGCAWIGTTCNLQFAYGVNYATFSSNQHSRSVLIAHEMGHNNGANHFNGDYIMNPFVNSADQGFSEATIKSFNSQFDDKTDCVGPYEEPTPQSLSPATSPSSSPTISTKAPINSATSSPVTSPSSSPTISTKAPISSATKSPVTSPSSSPTSLTKPPSSTPGGTVVTRKQVIFTVGVNNIADFGLGEVITSIPAPEVNTDLTINYKGNINAFQCDPETYEENIEVVDDVLGPFDILTICVKEESDDNDVIVDSIQSLSLFQASSQVSFSAITNHDPENNELVQTSCNTKNICQVQIQLINAFFGKEKGSIEVSGKALLKASVPSSRNLLDLSYQTKTSIRGKAKRYLEEEENNGFTLTVNLDERCEGGDIGQVFNSLSSMFAP